MQRNGVTPARPTPLTVAQASSGLTATGLTALASLEANLAWELHLQSAATFEAPPPYRATARYDTLTATVASLLIRDRLTPAEFDSLKRAQDELTRLHEQLEDDGDLTWGRASDDSDLTWGVRGATGWIQAGMQFGRAA